jgi:predicted nucleic acid-binding Zn ribbon protein
MSIATPDTMPSLPTARALLTASGRQCPACSRPLTGRQQACSGKCRATLSRERKADELRVLVLAVKQAAEALGRVLENRT